MIRYSSLTADPNGMYVFDRAVKQSKLFIDPKKLFKILGRVRFAQSRGIGGDQYTKIMFYIVAMAVRHFILVGREKERVLFLPACSHSCLPCFLKRDLFALVWHPN